MCPSIQGGTHRCNCWLHRRNYPHFDRVSWNTHWHLQKESNFQKNVKFEELKQTFSIIDSMFIRMIASWDCYRQIGLGHKSQSWTFQHVYDTHTQYSDVSSNRGGFQIVTSWAKNDHNYMNFWECSIYVYCIEYEIKFCHNYLTIPAKIKTRCVKRSSKTFSCLRYVQQLDRVFHHNLMPLFSVNSMDSINGFYPQCTIHPCDTLDNSYRNSNKQTDWQNSCACISEYWKGIQSLEQLCMHILLYQGTQLYTHVYLFCSILYYLLIQNLWPYCYNPAPRDNFQAYSKIWHFSQSK